MILAENSNTTKFIKMAQGIAQSLLCGHFAFLPSSSLEKSPATAQKTTFLKRIANEHF